MVIVAIVSRGRGTSRLVVTGVIVGVVVVREPTSAIHRSLTATTSTTAAETSELAVVSSLCDERRNDRRTNP
jgi:hypothetical protein